MVLAVETHSAHIDDREPVSPSVAQRLLDSGAYGKSQVPRDRPSRHVALEGVPRTTVKWGEPHRRNGELTMPASLLLVPF